jgi:hypothetical protein
MSAREGFHKMRKLFAILIVLLFSTTIITTSGGALADSETIELSCKGVRTTDFRSYGAQKNRVEETSARIFINLELGMVRHVPEGMAPSLLITKRIGMRIVSGGKGDDLQGGRIIAQSVDPINFGCCAKSLILSNKNNLHSNRPMEVVITWLKGNSYVDNWDQEQQTISLVTWRLICKNKTTQGNNINSKPPEYPLWQCRLTVHSFCHPSIHRRIRPLRIEMSQTLRYETGSLAPNILMTDRSPIVG